MPDFTEFQPQPMDPDIGSSKPKWRIGRIILWVIVVIVLVFIVVQYLNASRYDALVQVISEDRIGVNPTGEKLDFGDLPRDKDAVRRVDLKSSGNIASYVIVWKRGDIADLIKVSKNFFTLAPGASEELEFSLHVPSSAEYRYYNGKVIIFRIPKFW